ncbi:toxin ParE [Candidatus Termititenax aidoneus]|uniref:Toxin ParE n=1 Tax=Termititenax aidoneus TaxID=2218524 RepID=A0A388TBX7_TERA1|nr:toxin ParE [Candidatus Termititenax aidoneus]
MKLRYYKVIVSERAADMLVKHAAFLAQVNVTAARRLVAEFEIKAMTLETLPERYPRLLHPLITKNKYRKLLFEKRYLLVYQIKKNTVYIDAVVDCRQDYSWLL